MTDQLSDIVAHMLHTGVNARRNLARGLIITYMAPNPDEDRRLFTFSAARHTAYPDDRELSILHAHLRRAWARHPTAIAYNVTDWQKRTHRLRAGGLLGVYTIAWQQWPIKRIFDAPPELLPTLQAALAHR